MKIGLEYIKYRWKARKRHGIHSPYVYSLSDQGLSIRLNSKEQGLLNELFHVLGNDHSEIEIQDFGVGSKKLGTTRKISQIFRTSSSKGKYGKLLFQLCRHFQPDRILEFGTSLGVGTSYMKLGNPEAQLTSIEACPSTRSIALRTFSQLGLDGIESLEMTFDAFLASATNRSYDLVYIDGHHDGKALLHYLEELRPLTHEETLFILDDIRWSTSMKDAWDSLVADPHYHVSLDFFRCGILVQRPAQQKEHFALRP